MPHSPGSLHTRYRIFTPPRTYQFTHDMSAHVKQPYQVLSDVCVPCACAGTANTCSPSSHAAFHPSLGRCRAAVWALWCVLRCSSKQYGFIHSRSRRKMPSAPCNRGRGSEISFLMEKLWRCVGPYGEMSDPQDGYILRDYSEKSVSCKFSEIAFPAGARST